MGFEGVGEVEARMGQGRFGEEAIVELPAKFQMQDMMIAYLYIRIQL